MFCKCINRLNKVANNLVCLIFQHLSESINSLFYASTSNRKCSQIFIIFWVRTLIVRIHFALKLFSALSQPFGKLKNSFTQLVAEVLYVKESRESLLAVALNEW